MKVLRFIKRDFTLKKYDQLLKKIGAGDYRLKMMENIIRHDVDRSLTNALKMASLEYKRNIKTTYYFRFPKTFNQKIIQKIFKMGHEIGFHYEVLDKARGNLNNAIKIFEKEWAHFSKWNAETICMHGNPLSPWDNRNLWKKFDLKKYNVKYEGYLSFNFNNISYFTDTGRKWNNSKNSIKDITNSVLKKIKNSDQLIAEIKNIKRFYILTHPCRWNDNVVQWLKELIWQNVKNMGKRLLK
jgi:hypothetical protein